MPGRLTFTSPYGRRYTLVPSHAVLQLDHERAISLIRESIDEGAGGQALRQLAEAAGLDLRNREQVIEALARELESGRLIAIVVEEEFVGQGVLGGDPTDWDDLPNLADLRKTEPSDASHTLALQLLDYSGHPYAGVELTLRLASGAEQRIALDDRGSWSGREIDGPGAARLQLPESLELPSALARRKPPDGFAQQPSDVPIARRPTQPLSLALDEAHRLVVQPPATHPTVSLPGSLFASESAFPGPGIAHLVKYAQELTDQDKTARIGIFGHTDVTDDVDANKQLSERRAQAAYALLTGDYDLFVAVAQAENWSRSNYQTMLRVLGCNPSAIDGEEGVQTALAIAEFRRCYNLDTWHDEGRARAYGSLPEGDVLDDATKMAIVDAYHAEMAGRLDAARFLGPGHMGCGEFNRLGDDHEENRRVTLAIYGADAPSEANFPCRAGDAGACEVDEGGTFRCRFYRERIREEQVRDDLDPFWDFQWLGTVSGKAHLSALTHLPDTNQAEFVVRRFRPAAGAEDGGKGSAPTSGVELAKLPGLIRGGVAYALWPFGVDEDPFEVARWFAAPTTAALLRDYLPYYFTVTAHGWWGVSDAPSYALETMSLSTSEAGWAFGLATTGDILLVPSNELGDTKDHRVSSLRLAARRTAGFES